MIATLIVNCIAVVLALLAMDHRLRYLLNFAFLIFAVFLGIRYMWGNDMPGYYRMYVEFNAGSGDIFDLESIDYRGGKEYGWIILNILCKPIGFLGLQIVLSIFQNYVVYSFIKRNVNPRWYWFATFLYCFGANYMVLSASMMRQSLAMMIFLYACPYIAKKKIIPSVLLVLLAASMHQSAFILLPFCFLGYLKANWGNKDLVWIGVFMLVWMLFANSLLTGVINKFILSDTFANFDVYMNETNYIAGITNLFYVAINFLLLVHLKNVYRPEYKVIIILCFIAILFFFLMQLSTMIIRLSYYFSLFSIAGYPILMQCWKFNKYIKSCLILTILALNLREFWLFFYSDIWNSAYFDYQTIFQFQY